MARGLDASRLAGIGYCLGGALVLELARTGANLKAVVGVHSALHAITPAHTPRIKGEVLVHLGGDDPFAPPEQRTAFEADISDAGIQWHVHIYGGARHRFTNATLDGREMPADVGAEVGR